MLLRKHISSIQENLADLFIELYIERLEMSIRRTIDDDGLCVYALLRLLKLYIFQTSYVWGNLYEKLSPHLGLLQKCIPPFFSFSFSFILFF